VLITLVAAKENNVFRNRLNILSCQNCQNFF